MRHSLILIAFLGLAACSGTIAPPAIPPSDFSTRPVIDDKGFAETTIVQDFPMERTALRAWLGEDNKIVAAMDGGDKVAGPVESVYFDGEWPQKGANRRIELTDGHYVLEQVLLNTEERFEYQVWNMTNEVSRNVDYIHGIQIFEPLPEGGTRMIWTYKVKPNAGFKRLFVQRFVDNAIEPMLSGALTTVAAQAEQAVQIDADASHGVQP